MAGEYYTEPPMYGLRPSPQVETDLGPIGVTGIEARIDKGVKVTVEGVQSGTPAFGKFNKGDSAQPSGLGEGAITPFKRPNGA